jgi:spore coat protein H
VRAAQLATFLLVFFVCLTGCTDSGRPSAATATNGPPKISPADRAANEFFAGPIQHFEVVIPGPAMESLRQERRKPVPATVRIGTQVFTNVAVHVKGAAGSTRSIDDNPALTLNFDKFVDGQSFSGLDKLHLNNSVQDESLLNESIASELYRRIDIPTARTTHGIVTLNGRRLGLYVVKEGYNRSFLRRNFADASGNLYDGGFIRDIDQELERDAGSGPDDRADLRRLLAAVQEPDAARRLERLRATLDIERFIRECAMQSILVDWDGYGMNRNNYRLYHAPSTGRFVFIPHGMDQLFGDRGRNVETPGAGMVAQVVFAYPKHREQFFDEFSSLLTNHVTEEFLSTHVATVRARLNTALKSFAPGEAQWRRERMEVQLRRAVFRIQSCRELLDARPKDLPLAPGQSQSVAGWRPKYNRGQARMEVVQEDSKKLLWLAAQARDTVVSFRSTVRLTTGRYRFEATVRTRGIEAAKENPAWGGAGLRISAGQPAQRLTDDGEWRTVSYEFAVPEPREVELVAELRAHRGEAWFKADSLTLRRL